MEKKITFATLKSFIKNNADNLYLQTLSDFDGMQDCVIPCKHENKIEKTQIDFTNKNTLGITGAWFVGSSRDYIQRTKNGFNIYNCCGEFNIITK